MKKIFMKPVMNIDVFDSENVLTTSTVNGTPLDSPESIDNGQYQKATASWASDELTFTF